MEEGRSVHVLAASNPLYGAVNFIVLTLPPEWRVSAGHIPPEIDEVRIVDRVLWVITGSTTNYAYNLRSKRALEIKVTTSKKPRKIKNPHVLRTKIYGHEAYYCFGEEKVGLIKRKTVDTLSIFFYCEHTGRHVEIKFRGLNVRDLLHEILEYVGSSRCH